MITFGFGGAIGQVHFDWKGDTAELKRVFAQLKARIHDDTAHITNNMRRRGGGIVDIELVDMADLEPNYYQLKMTFETCDSMGANFINSTLEETGRSLRAFVGEQENWPAESKEATIIMAIYPIIRPNA